jgi:hypothetical protein
MAGGDGTGASLPVGFWGEEPGSLSGFAEVGGLGGDDFVVPSKAAVVEALAEEDYVCYCVVDCEYYLLIVSILSCGTGGRADHRRQNSLEHSAENIEHIAREPDDDKL